MNAPQTHFQPASEAQSRRCDHCHAPFAPKRAWARFCKPKCRNDFHLAIAHKADAEKLDLIARVLKHVGESVGGEIGSDIEAMDPKAVLGAIRQ